VRVWDAHASALAFPLLLSHVSVAVLAHETYAFHDGSHAGTRFPTMGQENVQPAVVWSFGQCAEATFAQ
jgi:hypothetical protein